MLTRPECVAEIAQNANRSTRPLVCPALVAPVLSGILLLLLTSSVGCMYSYFYTVVVVDELEGDVEAASDGTTYACAPSYYEGLESSSAGGLLMKLDCDDSFLSLEIDAPVQVGTSSVPTTLAVFLKNRDRLTPDIATNANLTVTEMSIETRFNDDEDTAEYGEVEALTFRGRVQVDHDDETGRFRIDLSILHEETFGVRESHYD